MSEQEQAFVDAVDFDSSPKEDVIKALNILLHDPEGRELY